MFAGAEKTARHAGSSMLVIYLFVRYELRCGVYEVTWMPTQRAMQDQNAARFCDTNATQRKISRRGDKLGCHNAHPAIRV